MLRFLTTILVIGSGVMLVIDLNERRRNESILMGWCLLFSLILFWAAT